MQQGKPGTPIVYYVFDVLEIEGEPVVDLPLVERRKLLEGLLDRRNKTVRLSETFDDGEALLEAAKQQQLEGIMAKRLDSKYLPGRRTPRLAEDQDPLRAGVRHRRLHEGNGPPRLELRRARSRLLRGQRARVRRQRRHRLQQQGDREAARQAAAAPARHFAVPRGSEDAEGAEERRDLGRAEAHRRGRVRGMDARRPPPRSVLQGPARGQVRGRGAARGADHRRRQEGLARAEALESRQGLLSGRADHERRSARVLPGGCARAGAAPQGAPLHDGPLARRDRGQEVLPEGRAVAHAGVDPDVPHAGLDEGVAEDEEVGRTSRSSTTSSRCSGW